MVPAMLNVPRADTLALPRVEAVVIGASVGGIGALRTVLPALPAGTPFPVVIVVHVHRQSDTPLVGIFSTISAVAVREALDKEPVEGGTVWFAPADYHLLVEADRTFSLSIEGLVNYSRPAIDPLFESAAVAYGPSLVGIVLTGGSPDGARGAAAIRDAGGVLVVQDPSGAEGPTMPLAALARVRPDAVGGIEEIANMLRAAALARAR
jgi:two-component system, chemotaxis family, protein-glutamate methylesterase/glutaminase